MPTIELKMEIGKREISVRRLAMVLVMLSMIIALIPAVMAGDPTGESTLEEDPGAPVDYVWILICGFLVMFMQPGFAMLEAGVSRAKNNTNVLMKNLVDFSMGSRAFFVIGFALMMGTSAYMLFGTDGFFLAGGSYDVGTALTSTSRVRVLFMRSVDMSHSLGVCYWDRE